MSAGNESPNGWGKFLRILFYLVVLLILGSVLTAWFTMRRGGMVLTNKGVEISDASGSSRTLDLTGLRDSVEKVAEDFLKKPILSPKLKEVEIEVPPTVVKDASNQIRTVLVDNNHQFVQAVEPDRIRLIVILNSRDWPALSEKLRTAAEKDGLVYRGPSETGVSDNADSVVAQIDIYRKKVKTP
jgi:hypothetical protein